MQTDLILASYEEAGALLTGHFVLSSGRHSARYLQSALVLMQPKRAAQLAEQLVALLGEILPVDAVISPALGGLIIGHEAARALNTPFLFTERKEGAMTLRRGFVIKPGARLLVVEDVVTTGGSVRECMAVARSHGGEIVAVASLVDRAPAAGNRFDVPFYSLVQLEVPTFAADECPLCREGTLPAIKPGSRAGR